MNGEGDDDDMAAGPILEALPAHHRHCPSEVAGSPFHRRLELPPPPAVLVVEAQLVVGVKALLVIHH